MTEAFTTEIKQDIREIFQRLNKMSENMAKLTAQTELHEKMYTGWQILHDTQLNHEHRLLNMEDDRLKRADHSDRLSDHQGRLEALEEERSKRQEGVKAWQMWVALIVISVVEEALKRFFHL